MAGKEVARYVSWHGGAVLKFWSGKRWSTVLGFLWGKCVWVIGRVLGSKLRPREALALTPSMMYP